MTYRYHPHILEALSAHGLVPQAHTPPEFLRDAVRDLYLYEIRWLRQRLMTGAIRKQDYAGHVVALRKRYLLLSVPLPRWVEPATGEPGER